LRLSNTLDARFCIYAVEEAFEKYGRPEIFNSDQGSQFTSLEYFNLLSSNNVKISLDGKGRCIDNIFIERLWRTLKYEDVYIKSYETGEEAYKNIKDFFSFL
jgi:putative transposase